MIIDFSFGNFKSFKEIQTLNLTAANIKSRDKTLDENNILSRNSIELLKSKAIYGANASGKSNIIRALVAFIAIVNGSFKDEEILKALIENFSLSNETKDKPSFFQIKFILYNKIFRYGFEADENKIHSEWLFESKSLKTEKQLFVRHNNKIEINKKLYKEGQKLVDITEGKSNELLNDKVLLLSAVKTINGPISKSIVDYIIKIIVVSGLGIRQMLKQAIESMKDEDMRVKIKQMLQIADVGINDIDLYEITEKNIPKNAPEELISFLKDGKKLNEVFLDHIVYDSKNKRIGEIPFMLSRDESEGTKKMFELSVFIIDAIEQGRPLFIDEFDARFHPDLTKKLVQFFNSKTNDSTQFIITTHDTGLLSSDILRRDQIAFVEKDKYGRSKLYSLADFKGIRNDASLEKDYNKGKFGAVPYLGNFESVIN